MFRPFVINFCTPKEILILQNADICGSLMFVISGLDFLPQSIQFIAILFENAMKHT